MLGPKRTIESVTRELIEGLDKGTVVLRPEERGGISLEDAKTMFGEALAQSRRTERFLLIASLISSVTGLVAVVLSILNLAQIDGRVVLVIFLCSALAGSAFLYRLFKVRERTVELKTFSYCLKYTDPNTAQNLMPMVFPKLPKKKELTQ